MMEELRRQLERKVGPLPLWTWAVFAYLASELIVATLEGETVTAVRDADRLVQRARSWRGIADELAEALVEPLADRLAGALARRGVFTMTPLGGSRTARSEDL